MHGNVFIMELTGNPLSPLQMHTVDKHPLHAWKHNKFYQTPCVYAKQYLYNRRGWAFIGGYTVGQHIGTAIIG